VIVSTPPPSKAPPGTGGGSATAGAGPAAGDRGAAVGGIAGGCGELAARCEGGGGMAKGAAPLSRGRCGVAAHSASNFSRASSTRAMSPVRAISNGPGERERRSVKRASAARKTATGSTSSGAIPSTRRAFPRCTASIPSHCRQGSKGASFAMIQPPVGENA
jgi:hypothetical protein